MLKRIHIPTFSTSHVKIHQDVQREQLMYFWTVPGKKDGMPGLADIANDIFSEGVGSRLFSRLVDKDQIAESVDSGAWEMQENGVFLIIATPKEGKLESCRKVIEEELQKV